MKPVAFGEEVNYLFNLGFKLEISDALLILGILIITLGIYLISLPVAVMFLGFSLVVLAFLMSPKRGSEKRGGGE
jgi:hypothetical protein